MKKEFTVMDALTALEIIEGLTEDTDEETYIEAWQFMVDSELAWNLQGSYGRTAESLIRAGVISE